MSYRHRFPFIYSLHNHKLIFLIWKVYIYISRTFYKVIDICTLQTLKSKCCLWKKVKVYNQKKTYKSIFYAYRIYDLDFCTFIKTLGWDTWETNKIFNSGWTPIVNLTIFTTGLINTKGATLNQYFMTLKHKFIKWFVSFSGLEVCLFLMIYKSIILNTDFFLNLYLQIFFVNKCIQKSNHSVGCLYDIFIKFLAYTVQCFNFT